MSRGVDMNDCGTGDDFHDDATESRSLCITFSSTPASMEACNVNIYKPSEEQCVKIFSTKHATDREAALREIQNVLLKKITLNSYVSTYPNHCALVLDGIQGKEFSMQGERFNHVFHGSKSNTPVLLYEAKGDADLAVQWTRNYPGYHAVELSTPLRAATTSVGPLTCILHGGQGNIRDHGTMKLQGADYTFVLDTHPVIDLLRSNKQLLGTEMTEEDKCNDVWFRVDCNVFDDAVNTIHKKIFNKTPQFYDLSKFCARLKRPNNLSWLDAPAFVANSRHEHKQLYNDFLNSQVEITLKIDIEYIPSIGE